MDDKQQMARPRKRTPGHRPSLLALVALAILVAAACGGAGAATNPTTTDAWIRPPMGLDLPAAGYLTIIGAPDAADALVGASSPIATSIEVHETMAGASGMTGMQPVARLEIAAGATVALAPGGYHLMLFGLTSMPAVGETVELTLTFETAGEVTVMAEVRAG